MLITRLRRVGGSVMLAVPPSLLDVLDLQAGAEVTLTVEQDRLIVRDRHKPRYTLEDLLAQTDPAEALSDEDRVWTGSGPVGRELI